MAKCQSCGGTGEKTIRVKEKDLNGKNTGLYNPNNSAMRYL
jgi:hypothetical protein